MNEHLSTKEVFDMTPRSFIVSEDPETAHLMAQNELLRAKTSLLKCAAGVATIVAVLGTAAGIEALVRW